MDETVALDQVTEPLRIFEMAIMSAVHHFLLAVCVSRGKYLSPTFNARLGNEIVLAADE